jgi:cell division protein FtsW (lipid II flippase)
MNNRPLKDRLFWRMSAVEDQQKYEGLLLIVAALFIFINAIALSLALEGAIEFSHLKAPIIWLLLSTIVYFFLLIFLPSHDPFIFPVFALLSGWGLVLLDRLAPNFLDRQALWLLIGVAGLLAASIFPKDMVLLKQYRYTWLILGMILLGATLLFGVNPSGQGLTLWLGLPLLGNVFFQPSELLKLLLIIFLASYFSERGSLFLLKKRAGIRYTLAYLVPLALMWGFCIVLLVWQQDMGAATLFFAVFIAMIFLATGRWEYVLGGSLLLVVAGIAGYLVFDLVTLRVDTWLNPWPEATSRGFQIVQSLYAVASGGISGQGVAQGYPNYIPVVHSDFAFAAISEEWGYVGSLSVLICFAILAYRGLRIASRTNQLFNLFLAAGITVMFSAQSFLIMAGVTKVLPLTGVTLPFVSYGGSSLLISCVMVGLMLNLSAKDPG